MENSPITIEDWFTLYRSEEIPATQLLGYEDQMKAMKAICLGVSSGLCHKVLFFGVPGNGKTNFSFSLARAVNNEYKLNFSLAMLICERMPIETFDPDKIIRSLQEKVVKEALKRQPVIICFDEVDFMTPKLNSAGLTPNRAALCTWVRRFLNSDALKSSKTVIIGVTNNPSMIELSVFNRFKTPIYFEPTSPDIAEALIKKNLCESKEIIGGYFASINNLGFYPMGRDVMGACNAAKIHFDSGVCKTSTDKVLQAMIAGLGMPLPKKEIAAFEANEANLIELSTKYVMPNWMDVYEQNKI